MFFHSVVFAFFGLLVFCGTLIDGCRACARSGGEAECEAPHSKTTASSAHLHSNKNGHSLPPKQEHTNGLTFPVSKLEATNVVTLVNVQTKQADGAVNGDVVKESAPITEGRNIYNLLCISYKFVKGFLAITFYNL